MKLTEQELFDLGAAYASFGLSEIDQGIHLILPLRDIETGAHANDVFQELCDRFLNTNCTTGEDYQRAIIEWTKERGIDTGR